RSRRMPGSARRAQTGPRLARPSPDLIAEASQDRLVGHSVDRLDQDLNCRRPHNDQAEPEFPYPAQAIFLRGVSGNDPAAMERRTVVGRLLNGPLQTPD